MLMSI